MIGKTHADVRGNVTNYNRIKDLPMKLQVSFMLFQAFIVAFPDAIVAYCQQTHGRHRCPAAKHLARGAQFAHAI